MPEFGQSLRLDARLGSSLLPETAALVARMAAPPDGARAARIDAMIGMLKRTGIWAKLDFLYLLAAHDAQAARLNWRSADHALTAIDGPVFTRDRGYQGDGVGAYLDTGFSPTHEAVMTHDGLHLGCWSSTNIANNDQSDLGQSETLYLKPRVVVEPGMAVRISQQVTSFSDPVSTSVGHSVASRSGTNIQMYRDGVAIGNGSAPSVALEAVSFTILQARQGSLAFSARRIAAAHAGGSLSASQVAALHAAIRGYLEAVGAA